MRKLSLSCFLTLSLIVGVFAQSPQSFKYQAVVRDLSASIIANQLVSLKISLLVGSETGLIVYAETHSGTTNQFGTITLDIGKGSVESGIFSAIDWRLDNYFLKLEIDPTGGSDFQLMGTSQLLSVPYALHTTTSERFPDLTSEERDTMTNIQEGACFYNTTTKRLNFYNGDNWFELSGTCEPQPTLANAGPDQTDVCSTTTLEGNTPIIGTGIWTIVSGTGGNVAEPNNPTSQFSGIEGQSYELNWRISNACGSFEDNVTITMGLPPFLANAGPDQLNTTSPVTLAGSDPGTSTGLWSIISGQNGILNEASNPSSQFYGEEGETYFLSWTLTSACGSNSDEVIISLSCLTSPTESDAGPDQLNVQAVSTNLQGNLPIVGTGSWTIINGTGGNIVEPSSPTSTFTGLEGNSYTLRWTISTLHCDSTYDEVEISFWVCAQSLTDYRDSNNYPTVLIGTHCWMAKNINIGTRIEGNTNMLNNSTLEKYCSSNLESNCDVYGGLYQWSEMMQYVTTPGTQGICTPGWHIPTDAEWKTLEGSVDSQYGIGDQIWDLTGDRGLDAGGKLKETGTVHWVFPNTGASNSSGFTAFGGGARNTDGSYPGFQIYGRYWTSTENGTLAFRHFLTTGRADIARDEANKLFGLSVRCVKD
jgi:uncharacterized protein (TIGR02145 family)